MKSFKRIVSLVLTIFLFVGAAALPASAAGRYMKTGMAFVDASALRLRSAPNTSSKTLASAARNEVVILLEKTGSWYKVIYNLQTGYMHAGYLSAATRENAELGYGEVNISAVNVRSGPSTGYSVLTQARSGDMAYIIGINDGWFKVIYGQKIGYIRSDYLDLTEYPYENKASAKSPLFFRGGKSTGLKPSAAALSGANTGSLARQIIATAKKYIGVPYVWGGTTPKGFDCSGFVQYVFAAHGISLPRVSKQQWTVGTSVSKASLIPGDLVFFATGGSGISHLGIYIGDNQFIHASSSKGVTISSLTSSYWSGVYYGARRVL